jgi:hypothetical protein
VWVADVEALRGELAQKDPRIIRGPQETFYHTREIGAEDGNGRVLCFGEDIPAYRQRAARGCQNILTSLDLQPLRSSATKTPAPEQPAPTANIRRRAALGGGNLDADAFNFLGRRRWGRSSPAGLPLRCGLDIRRRGSRRQRTLVCTFLLLVPPPLLCPWLALRSPAQG